MENFNNIYYVYKHFIDDKDKPFYIGMGTKIRYKDKNRSKEWKEYIKNKEWKYEIIKNGLTIIEASNLEKELIKLYGRINYDENGILINKSSGGSTNRGFIGSFKGKKHTEETKRRISESHKGEKNPMFGKHMSDKNKIIMMSIHKGKIISEETKRKISESHKGILHTEETKRKISNANKGILHTEETKRKISNANKGIKRTDNMKEKYKNIALNREKYECPYCLRKMDIGNLTKHKKICILKK